MKSLKLFCGVLALFVIASLLVVFLVPNFQLRTYEMNRAYGVAFGISSTTLFFLLFWIIKEIKSYVMKISLFFINGFALIFAIGNLAVYYAKIDPDIQYRDYKTLYVNKENTDEKILRQYNVNWKTLKYEYQNNQVEDYGIFRYYKFYRVDTLKLHKNKWKRVD